MDNVIPFPKRTTEHRPIAVRSVSEEYAYLTRHFSGIGYQRETQSLIAHNGKTYDRLDVVDGRGQKHVFWFDVTSFTSLSGGASQHTSLGRQPTRPAGQAAQPISGWQIAGLVIAGLVVYEVLSYSAHRARQKHAIYRGYRR